MAPDETARNSNNSAESNAELAKSNDPIKVAFEQIEQTATKVNKRIGRNLLAAIGIGLVLGFIFLFSLFIEKSIFVLFMMTAVGIGSYEFSAALKNTGRNVPRFATILAAVAVVPVSYFYGALGQLISLALGIVFVFAWRFAKNIGKRMPAVTDFLDFSASALVVIYMGFLGSFAVLLSAEPRGEFWVLGLVIVVIAIDTSALAAGVSFGKTKLAPSISPSKTWEGLAGSILGSMLAGVLVAIFLLDKPWWFGLIFAAGLVVSATVGDLAESLIKRDLGIKDMSSFLPGHGGLMDRMDSMLPSCYMGYMFFLLLG